MFIAADMMLLFPISQLVPRNTATMCKGEFYLIVVLFGPCYSGRGAMLSLVGVGGGEQEVPQLPLVKSVL